MKKVGQLTGGNRLACCLFGLLMLPGILSGQANSLKLNGIFTENMVLQRDADLPVYGTAAEGEKVTVSLNGQQASAVAKDGKWKVHLKAMKAGGPFTMTVRGKNTLDLKNILLGDVWLCTGQSNMDPLGGFKREFKEMYKDIPSENNPNIRYFKVKIDCADEPRTEVVPAAEAKEPYWPAFGETWRESDPGASLAIAAVGYFFARKLESEVHVPIGIISVQRGATMAECWMSQSSLRSRPEFADILDIYQKSLSAQPAAEEKYQRDLADWRARRAAGDKNLGKAPWQPMGPANYMRPSALYYGMIAPLHAFRIKGILWYQGEGNSGKAIQYRTLFPALITSWREAWGQGDFPFLFVQLAAYQKINALPDDADWEYLREAQTMALAVPNTGMAVAIESGMQDNIHPAYKQAVGDRLAMAALKVAYGKNVVASGPTYKRAKFEGSQAIVEFENIGGGLCAKELDLDMGKIHLPASELRGFAVCGADKCFKWAKAEIKGDTVVCSSPEVETAVAVRYAWANFPLCNLFNKDGLPAGPFRSDDFEMGAAARADRMMNAEKIKKEGNAK
ncbi:MAG: sialate O-acetylesterase [Verrucomicrobiota bacterium]